MIDESESGFMFPAERIFLKHYSERIPENLLALYSPSHGFGHNGTWLKEHELANRISLYQEHRTIIQAWPKARFRGDILQASGLSICHLGLKEFGWRIASVFDGCSKDVSFRLVRIVQWVASLWNRYDRGSVLNRIDNDPSAFNVPVRANLPQNSHEQQDCEDGNNRCGGGIYVLNPIARIGGVVGCLALAFLFSWYGVASLLLYDGWAAAARFSGLLILGYASIITLFVFASGCLCLRC